MQNFSINNFNRGENNPPPKKNFDFKLYKKNTINSLNEIEYFLNNFQKFVKCFKFSKFFK